jgi:hypothetical protein
MFARFALTAVVAAIVGCGPADDAAGASRLVVQMSDALSAADVSSVELTISAADIGTPMVRNLQKSGGVWQGVIGGIPAGPGRTFTASAYNSGGTALFSGQATGVTISGGATTAIALTLQQIAPSPPFANQVPVIDSLIATADSCAMSGPIGLTVSAHDPDGNPLTYQWTATAGHFSGNGQPSTTWIAPASAGPQTVTVLVNDGVGEPAAISVTIDVVP